MKKLALLFLVVCLVGTATAQELSKEEKKKVKKELKEYLKNPESYVKKMEDQKEEVLELETELESKSQTIADQNISITELNGEVGDLKSSLAQKEGELAAAEDAAICDGFPEGSTYRVQIGLYQGFDISAYFDELKFVLFESVDGLSRYSIGNFSDVNEAISFKHDIKKMGIKDAFVTEYVAGERNTEFSEEQIVK